MSKDIPEYDENDLFVQPYDDTYPVRLLAMGFKEKFEQAQVVADAVYSAVKDMLPVAQEMKYSISKKSRYVVDASEATLKALEEGRIKLSTEKGKLVAQLRQADGKYGERLSIRKESLRKGIDIGQVATILQMKALEESIQQISGQIDSISRCVHEVLQGQQNDRIALYYSGVSLYLEAKNANDKELRRALLVQSLKTLSESSFQLVATMKSDIEYLAGGRYKSEKKKQVELINEKALNICKCFEFVHQASILRAAIYCNEGEMLAMVSVLSEYSRFIEETIVKNSVLLSQVEALTDKNNLGIWKRRAELRLDVQDVQKLLVEKNSVLYLGLLEEC